MLLLGLEIDGDMVDTILSGSETVEEFKATLDPNADDEVVQQWLTGTIKEISDEEFARGRGRRNELMEGKIRRQASQLNQRDIAAMLVAVINGERDVARSILRQSRQSAPEQTPEQTPQRPAER